MKKIIGLILVINSMAILAPAFASDGGVPGVTTFPQCLATGEC